MRKSGYSGPMRWFPPRLLSRPRLRLSTGLLVVLALLLHSAPVSAPVSGFGIPGLAAAGWAAGDICHAGGSGDAPLPAPTPSHHDGHCLLCQLGGMALPPGATPYLVPARFAVAQPNAAEPQPSGGLIWRPYAPRAPPTIG